MTNDKTQTTLEIIADELSEEIGCVFVKDYIYTIDEVRKERLKNLLLSFASEVKRSSIEPGQHKRLLKQKSQKQKQLLLAQLSGKILNAAKEFSGGALITVRDRRPRGKILFVVLESKTGLTAREIRLLQVFLCRNDVIVATKSGISGVSADLIISDESEGKK